MKIAEKSQIKPELLSPAGSLDSLKAAIAAGADAVYFGSTSFSNRARAKNFDDDSITDAIKLAHSCGVKTHITVNTRVRDREMDDVLSLADLVLSSADPTDALIVADLGVAAMIKKRYPDAVLHASTQTSLSSLSDCAELKKAGFSRIVLPRELSLSEIREISKNSPIETEIFIHGAHCVSLSGQCLLSYVMGGRSGNRGECAQPCRLPYAVSASLSESDAPETGKSRTPLSLADMCLAGDMANICSSGVASLKIEGRLKPDSYVYGVTRIYRRLIDENRNAEQAEINALAQLFYRGFTDGYLKNSYRKMSATQSNSSRNSAEIRTSAVNYNAEIAKRSLIFKNSAENKISITAHLILCENTPSSLTFSAAYITASVTGDTPSTASGKPIDKSFAARSLTKLGETEFVLSDENLTCDIGENLWLPTSSLNDLRRRAAAELSDKLSKNKNAKSENPAASQVSEITNYVSSGNDKIRPKSSRPEYAALFLDPHTLLDASPEKASEIISEFDRIYVPAAFYPEISEKLWQKSDFSPTCELCSYLPAIAPNDDRLKEIISSSVNTANACTRFLVHSIGQAKLVRETCTSPLFDISSVKIDFSYRTNITNTAALRFYEYYSPEDIYLSPELPSSAAAKMGYSTFAYGKLPLMTLSRCLICSGSCKKGNRGGRAVYEICTGEKINNPQSSSAIPPAPKPHRCRAYLTDRKGEKFFVTSDSDCVNYVCNSLPVWMADRLDEMKNCRSLLFYFTDEDADEIIGIMNDYANNIHRGGRRI
ncbi:MAG: U32 family peptidase [Eubacteriales bacterium]